MYKNYFFLNREIVELNKLLNGFSITSVFSQYKNLLTINCTKNEKEIFIEISTNPGDPYLHLRESFNRAKKNTVDVFGEIPKSTILSFEIAESDRIIKIQTDKYILYFTIRGKYTNVYLFYDNLIQTFKKSDEEIISSFEEEVNRTKFISSFRSLDFIEAYNGKEIQTIRKDHPTISKDIILEYKAVSKKDEDILNAGLLIRVVSDIQNRKLACFLDAKNFQVRLAVETFKSFPGTVIKTFPDYRQALDYLFSKKRYLNEQSKNFKVIDKYLSKELEFISSKLNNLKAVLDRGEQSEKYRKIADLLLSNIHRLKRGMHEISLKDFTGDEIINIKLDPKISCKKNIDNYYNKARGEKIKFEKAEKDFDSANKRLLFLREIEKKFNSDSKLSVTEDILKELNLKKDKKKNVKETMTSKFRTYLIDDKYYVYVGKDGKSNDMLTTKFAKQNDIWFHVRGLPGSHVVLRITDTKSKPPKSIIKIAATVAAYHSKAKTAGLVPVSYAQKKYVVKKKGMAPGKVLMLKEETVLVRPEIPKNCVFVSSS